MKFAKFAAVAAVATAIFLSACGKDEPVGPQGQAGQNVGAGNTQ